MSHTILRSPSPEHFSIFSLFQANKTSDSAFRFLLLFVFLVATGAAGQNPGQFTHISDYTHIGLILNSIVGPGPIPGTERLYASLVGATRFHLLAIDPVTGRVTVFDSPLVGETGAWGMILGPDGNVYLGTAPNAHLMKFDVAQGHIVDLGRPSSSAQWVWSLTVGSDNRIYGGTYPDCKLIRLDPTDETIADLGIVDAAQQYVRYVSASPDGIIYMGIGDAPGDIASYNIASGILHHLLSPSFQNSGFAYVYQSTDGAAYGILSPYAFRLSSSDATLIPWEAQGIPDSSTTLKDGTVLALEERNNTLVLEKRSPNGNSSVLPIAYSGDPTPLFRIGLGADGLLYGSAAQPSDLVQVDPATGAQTSIGSLGAGEAYSILPYGHTLVLGTYSDPPSALVSYDPRQPFDISPGSSNPTFVPIPNNNDSWRPYAMVSASEGTIYVGMMAGYGDTTGPLLVWNPISGDVAQYNAVPNQSIVSLTMADDFLVGGTSTEAGLGALSTATAAEVFVWDPVASQVARAIVPVPHVSTITDLVTEADGLVLGIAGDTIVELDPRSGTIARSRPLSNITPIYNSAGVDKAGRVWGLATSGIFLVDAGTLRASIVATPPVSITGGFGLSNDRIYFIAGPSLYSYGLPGTIGATVALTAAQPVPSYTGTLALNVLVQGVTSEIPTGSIAITADGKPLATASLKDGTAQVLLTLPPGTYDLVAVYSGDAYYVRSESSPLAIAVRGSALVTTTATPSSAAVGTKISFESTVAGVPSGAAVPTGTVELYDNGVFLGVSQLLSSGRALFSTSSLPAGYDAIAATYSGDANFASASSPPLTVSVQALHLTSNLSLAEIPYTGSIHVPITVVGEGGLTGPIAFECSGTPVGVSCAFSPPTLNGSGDTELILTSTSGSFASALLDSGSGAQRRMTCVCGTLLLLIFISARRSTRFALLMTTVVLSLCSCGTRYIPANDTGFTVKVTARQLCVPPAANCLGLSSEMNVPAVLEPPSH